MTDHHKDIDRWFEHLPERSSRIDDRYPAPSPLSKAGRIDARNEGMHLAEMRQIARHIERDAARTLEAYRREVDQVEATSRLLEDIKWALHRTKKTSQILADEDAELATKFAILDDEHFHTLRAQMLQAFRDV